ncbi:aminotransferase class I/II-fold pyridoxal phosphate-dependent enzyme [Kibdelosporangium phytohabitans]|uniref:aminotransferase class I/II-fold pyridoxal phosphate-dependent enzyme n=1 Tax=Kibdelosporangium phytohabitans TaxID=860235 RepID=UPI001A0D6081|nr:aminotransferase class I/II-fold pyridoxal phosphate-dependent enzyme [Kibdelosporangium phytohabitans]MBE1464099.1 aspartate/methionine/tyrosine aminotransferase [Kibdelosporangium phytohabitans]
MSPKEMLNLTDGHPRQALTDNQRRIIATLPSMFDQALDHAFADIELRAHQSFFGAMGQHSAPFGKGRILSTYSSTIALDIVARVLAERIQEVAVLHPTFDNIADLFSARGLRLHPITEQRIDDGDVELPSSIGAVVVVHPNNPTGWILTEERLRALAEACARNGQIVVMDSSFRGQDSRAHYDTYAVLEASGAEWIVVEDTGKLWSVSELKSGFLSWNEGSTLRFVKCFDEVMLSVSPVILLLIDKLAEEARTGGFAEMQTRLSEHRNLVAGLLEGTSLTLTDPGSRISVARITLPETGPDAYKTYSSLVERGIHTLPCSRFYWARPHEGDRQLRLSLSRPTPAVEKAARTLAEISRSA